VPPSDRKQVDPLDHTAFEGAQWVNLSANCQHIKNGSKAVVDIHTFTGIIVVGFILAALDRELNMELLSGWMKH
jgi:hypothetical protein